MEINSKILLDWFLIHGIKIIAIIGSAYIANKFIHIFIEKAIRKIVPPESFLTPEEEKKREDTLIKIISGFSVTLIWIIAILMALQEFGLQIAPFLATLGIAGVAVGFGGQYLIKDMISGLFIIIENQYRIGDVVCFDKVCGTVEDITLRTTTIRNLDGTVHHIPHGEIKITSNLSKGFARVNFSLAIDYDSDLEKVIAIINKIGKDISQDPQWKNSVISAPKFIKIDDFGDSAIIIKILGDTKPLKQWDITAEMRKRIKIAFDKEDIKIPFPQVVVHNKK
jgi:small conductance mechanosensitive channel